MTLRLIPRHTRAAWLLAFVVALAGCAGLTLKDQIAALMKEGQQLYAEKKYDPALDKFRQVIAKDPAHWQAYVWTARSFIAKGQWTDAISYGKKAFELSPKGQDVIPVFAEALFGGGSDALKSGRYAESVTHFVEFLKLEPGNARAWLNVARAYLGQQQFRQALDALVQGLATGGGAERGDLVRGLLDGGLKALSSGEYRSAIDMLREFLKYDSRNLQAYLNLGRAYLGEKQFRQALDVLVQGLAAGGGAERGDLVRELLDGGQKALSSGEYRPAIDLLKEFLKYDSKNLQAYLNLAKAYWEAGDRGDAIKAFREVLKLDPGQEEALRYLLRR